MGTSLLGKRDGVRTELLSADRPWNDWLPQGENVWLPGPAAGEDHEPGYYAAWRKAGRAFAADVAGLPAGQFAQVKVRLNFGQATEEAWLKVVRMEKEDYGGFRLIGEMQGDSQIWPHLKRGELYAIGWWSVKETKLP